MLILEEDIVKGNTFAQELGFEIPDDEVDTGRQVYLESVKTSHGSCLALAACKHFGYYAEIEFAPIGLQAADLTLQFTYPDWGWFHKLSDGLPLVLMYGTSSEVEQLINRFTLGLDPGMTVPLERQVPQIELLVCNALKDSLKEDDEKLVQEILKCRKKRPVLAAKAFQAAISGTQDEFQSALSAALAYFRSQESIFRGWSENMYICNELTSINLLAQRLGKKTPELPVSQAACLLTKESIESPVK